MRCSCQPVEFACLLGMVSALCFGGRLASGQDAREPVPPGPAKALERMQVPEGFVKQLFAAEPLVMDPISFYLDERNRVYVTESFRQNRGIEDNRDQAYWLLDDIAAQTVFDRLAMYRKWAHKRPNGMAYYSEYEDRVRLIIDTDGDGVADRAKVFADGFNHPLDGSGAGIIARDGDVYYTNLPNLWLLQDRNGDDVADRRLSLQFGFGVRIALRGHDMHGLAWGPDGKLYWSIGDRGYHLQTSDARVLHSPHTGAIFRCNPDGTELEVFHHGLRNPQEIAFDNYGNLFTGDNNSDAGDRARLVYAVDGGETGWRMEYQTLEGTNQRGPWNQEGIWHLENESQPAWTLPPVAHVTSGPSGMTFNPGTGLPARYDEHFFLCDFTGSNDGSRIISFGVQGDGAGFRIADEHTFIQGVLATDVDFGYDGRMYISDWGQGWGSNFEGRLLTVTHSESVSQPIVDEVRMLFAHGFAHRPLDELMRLLSHADRRVRQRAQFALADMGDPAIGALSHVALNSKNQLARLHGLWGVQMIAHQTGADDSRQKLYLNRIAPLLRDDDAEMRAQCAKVFGELAFAPALDELVALLNDDSLRVRYFAAQAIGQIGDPSALEAVLTMIWENEDRDVYLRHAGVMALYRFGDPELLMPLVNDLSSSVRLAALLALRRFEDARVAAFLNDPDESLVTEAARAINDIPIDAATSELAALIAPDLGGRRRASIDSGPTYRFIREVYLNLSDRINRLGIDDAHAADYGRLLASGALFADARANDVQELTTLEAPGDVADDYASRIFGTLTAPESGAYRFYIAGDDDCVLLLSTNDSPAHLRTIALVRGWTGPRAWEQSPSQISEPIVLEAGQSYYIEARHREGGGGDHLAVGWQLPSGELERPIGGGVEVKGNVPLLRRIINANLRTGQIRNAYALADLARDASIPMLMREEAMAALADWREPDVRDRVNGAYRPVDNALRDVDCIVSVLEKTLPGLIQESGPIAAKARAMAAEFDIALDNAANARAVADASLSSEERVLALAQLARAGDERLGQALEVALQSDEPRLRAAARSNLVALEDADVRAIYEPVFKSGDVEEKRQALIDLAGNKHPDAVALLSLQFDRLKSDDVHRDLVLDVLLAVQSCQSDELRSRALEFDQRPESSESEALLAWYEPALHGGSAKRGERVFQAGTAVSCIRCHTVNGRGGSEAGPDLSNVGRRLNRNDLLQSMILPDAQLAEGFAAPSAMIPVGDHLSRSQIRDLVEYLSTLK